MARYGAQYGPDLTFLGVDRCDWADESTYADADVVILGAPDRVRAARSRGGRGGGVAAVRPGRDHVVPGQPGGARGALGHRAPAPRRGRRHDVGPHPAPAGRE